MSARSSRLLDEITDELEMQIGPAAMDLGALRSTIDNDLVNSKISHSFSGHFLDAAIRAITVKLILFVCRTCEKNGHSLRKALEIMPDLAPEIERRRLEKRSDWPSSFLEISEVSDTIHAASATLKNITDSHEYARAQLSRDERYAHLLRGKSDLRTKQPESFEEFDDIAFREVEILAHRVLLLSQEVIRIWKFEVVNVDSKISIAENYSIDFWKALPILRQVEEGQQA